MAKNNRFLFIVIVLMMVSIIAYRINKPQSVHDWAEGKVIAGLTGELIENYAKTKGESGNYPPSWEELVRAKPFEHDVDEYFQNADYFKSDDVTWEASYDAKLNPPIRYIVTVSSPKGYKSKYSKITMDQDKNFIEYEQKTD